MEYGNRKLNALCQFVKNQPLSVDEALETYPELKGLEKKLRRNYAPFNHYMRRLSLEPAALQDSLMNYSRPDYSSSNPKQIIYCLVMETFRDPINLLSFRSRAKAAMMIQDRKEEKDVLIEEWFEKNLKL